MKKHLKYLRYLVRHKWFVMVASAKIGAPIWRALVHDMSKFLPSEWFPYAQSFYGGPFPPYSSFSAGQKCEFDCWSVSEEGVDQAFDLAWLKHQRRNPHHWQAWILREDCGSIKTLPMPEKFLLEMIADWAGAGKAITGRWDVCEWYKRNKLNIVLHHDSSRRVEQILQEEFGSCHR